MDINLLNILGNIDTLTIEERRTFEQDYIELVLLTRELDDWMKVLENTFGPPNKPKGQTPTKDMQKYTAKIGGIRSDQTLFYNTIQETPIFAMLWPWQDGERITLKMAVRAAES